MEPRCSLRMVTTNTILLIWECPALVFAHPTLLSTGMISHSCRLPLVLVVQVLPVLRGRKAQQGPWDQQGRKARQDLLEQLVQRDQQEHRVLLVPRGFKVRRLRLMAFGRQRPRTVLVMQVHSTVPALLL